MNKLQTGWLYTLTGAVSAVSLAACMPASKPYNIVYIMTDDHTAQMMSCYDNRYIETPNLDRIANDGVRFVNSFVANSLSGPSRACMFTGKHTCGNKFYDNTTCVFDGSQQTFPKILRENGYQTAVKVDSSVKIDDEVTLLGDGITVGMFGRSSGMGNAEALVNIGKNNPRFYVKDGKVVKEK